MCTNDEMMGSDVTDTRGDLLLAPETEPEPEEMWWRDSAGDWWQETGTPTYPRTTLVLPTQLHNTPIHHTLLVTLSPLLPLVNIWLSVVGGWLDDMTLTVSYILPITTTYQDSNYNWWFWDSYFTYTSAQSIVEAFSNNVILNFVIFIANHYEVVVYLIWCW